jgi:nitrite reductase (NADH) small subunit
MSDFVTVAKKDEVKEGEGKVVEIEGKTIALFNVEGHIYAIDNACKHKGGPLGGGVCDGGVVTCPWHQWKYDVTTGANVGNPQVKVDTFEVRVEGDEVKVKVE